MAILGLSNRQQLVIFLIVSVTIFFVGWAMVDFAVNGYKGHYLPEDGTLRNYWNWMWGFLVPATGFGLGLAYIVGAPDTDSNIWHSVGIFSTFIILAVGQLEDFLYFVLNGIPFPSTEEWWWMLFYGWFGTWTTEMHFVTVVVGIILVLVMWALIFKYCDD